MYGYIERQEMLNENWLLNIGNEEEEKLNKLLTRGENIYYRFPELSRVDYMFISTKSISNSIFSPYDEN